MATPIPTSPQALCDEIRAEAQRQSEQILQRARQDAEALLTQAAEQGERTRQQRLAAARAEAARRREQILATVALETNRLRSARLETLLQSIYEGIRAHIAPELPDTYRETLINLAVEALSQMGGNTFVVKLSPTDYAAPGPTLNQEISRRLGQSSCLSLTVSKEPALAEAGLIIQDNEGRQLWDNRLMKRLDRMWPELRRQIALGTSLVSTNNQPPVCK